jgi:hypothetical protein
MVDTEKYLGTGSIPAGQAKKSRKFNALRAACSAYFASLRY